MTVSGISSGSDIYSSGVQDRFKQRKENFDALEKALDSGDLAGAQTAFASIQQSMQQRGQVNQSQSGHTATGADTIGTDLDTLSTSLNSNDLAGAQKALATLQQDLRGVHHHRHHGHRGSTSIADGTGQTGADFKALLASLGSSDRSGAQAALNSLLEDLQKTQSVPSAGQPASPRVDFAALAKSLSADDLSGAQRAFAALQQDLHATRRRHSYAVDGTQTASAASLNGTMVNATA